MKLINKNGKEILDTKLIKEKFDLFLSDKSRRSYTTGTLVILGLIVYFIGILYNSLTTFWLALPLIYIAALVEYYKKNMKGIVYFLHSIFAVSILAMVYFKVWWNL